MVDDTLYSINYYKTSLTSFKEKRMAIYKCEKCGMSLGTMTCGTCDKELVHGSIKADDGHDIHVSECPDGHGKIKSPMCCGQDMTRTA